MALTDNDEEAKNLVLKTLPMMVQRTAFASLLSSATLALSAQCTCWIEPDSSYTLIDNASEWLMNGEVNADEGMFGPVTLPFDIQYFAEAASTVYISPNGLVNVDTLQYGSGTPNVLYLQDRRILAPFWADGDLRPACLGCNQVFYRLTPTALYVNWMEVGYYSGHTDKRNTFQLIITDGTDPVLPVGNNMSFCYRDMQWAAGDFQANPPQSGFGGNALVVASKADGWPPHSLVVGGFEQDNSTFNGAGMNGSGVNSLDSSGIYADLSDTSMHIPFDMVAWTCDTLVAKSQFGLTTNTAATAPPSMGMRFDNNANELWLEAPRLNGDRLRIDLLSMDGRLVRSFTRAGATARIQLNCGELPTGVYLVRVEGAHGVFSGRFLKD